VTVFGRLLERRSIINPGYATGWNDPAAIPPNSALGHSAAGVLVNQDTALGLMAVLACVRIISDAVAGLPLHAYTRTADVRQRVEPEPVLVADPFVGLRRHEGISQVMISLLLRGNAYAHVAVRDRLGRAQQLLVLDPDRVTVRQERDGSLTYRIGQIAVPTADIVHIRGLTLPGRLVGLSPIDAAATGLGIALAAEEYGARYYSQGVHVGGVLETQGRLTPEEAATLAARFAARHGGVATSHLPLILEGGLKWTPTAISPAQAAFLETRQFQRGEIAMLFGVPPHLIGDTQKSTSWGQGIEDQEIAFLTFTIKPWLTRIEEAITALLRTGVYARFSPEGLLRTDILARYQAYSIARTVGFLNNNEIRKLENLNPMSDEAMGDNYAAPFNSIAKAAPIPGASSNDGNDDPGIK